MDAHSIHNDVWEVEAGNSSVQPAGLAELWRRPLPGMAAQPVRRFCCRALATLGRPLVQAGSGWENALPSGDPFILALNHISRIEALLVPALLALHRGGRQVHFLADWNFLLWPVVGSLIRMNDPIIITRKPARPRMLNVFKVRYQSGETPFQQARRRLLAGQSVGIFPEGTVNDAAESLLRGRNGAARLSLETGAPIIPAGIQPAKPSAGSRFHPLIVNLGRPLRPAREFIGSTAPVAAVREWHECTMRAVADLSGKTWQSHNPRNNHASHDPSNPH